METSIGSKSRKVFDTPLDGALYMALKGFKVFPLKPGEKTPAITRWQSQATNDFDKIETFANSHPDCNWGVFVGGSGHCVLDVDCKHGASGASSLFLLQEAHGYLPETLTVRTPSGGLHYYFIGATKTTRSRIGAGLDTCSLGGFVVAPGSVIGEKAYAIEVEQEMQPIPSWLEEAVHFKESMAVETPKIDGIDSPENIEAAIEYLIRAEPCVLGGINSGENLIKVFYMVRDLGISQEKAQELVLEHYNPRCLPPWDMDAEEDRQHFQNKLKNAYRYPQNKELGAKTNEAKIKTAIEAGLTPAFPSPEECANILDKVDAEKRREQAEVEYNALPEERKAEIAEAVKAMRFGEKTSPANHPTPLADAMAAGFEPVENHLPEVGKKVKKAINVLDAADIDGSKIPPRDWVMRERYIGAFISEIISPGGVGKSTLSLLDALSVASGNPFTGYPVAQSGAVWMFNAEDPIDELNRRVVAAAAHHSINLKALKHKLYLSSGRKNKLILAVQTKQGVVKNSTAVKDMIEFITANKIKLFIADPLVRLHQADNENDNKSMDVVMDAFSDIAEQTGCSICLVHHSNKAASYSDSKTGDANASRGASSVINAARIAHVIAPMSEEEASKFGLTPEDRRWYFRLDNAKANLQPPADGAKWYKRVSVTLPNGDSVGTVEAIVFKDVMAERKKQELLQARELLGLVLCRILTPGQSMEVGEATNRIAGEVEGAVIFGEAASAKRRRVILYEIIGEGLAKDGKDFGIVTSTGKRPSLIYCE